MIVSLLNTLTYLILGPIITLISLPLLILILAINEIARYVVSTVLHKEYSGKVTLVSHGTDGIWGYKKPGSTRNFFVLVSAERGFLNFELFRHYIEDILFKVTDLNGNRPYAKLENILTSKHGYVCWKKDDDFDIRNHLRVIDGCCTEKEFLENMSQLCEDMDESKPQWEFIIVPKYIDDSGEEKSVLLIRFLHAYMDGLSLIMLLEKYWSTGFEYSINPLKFNIASWKMALIYLNTLLYGPLLICQMVCKKYYYKAWIFNHSETQGKSPSKKNFAQSKYMDTKIIKKIRLNHPGTTLTNVISTAFVTAVTKVLPKDRLINEIRVGELIAILPYPNSHPQNRFTSFSFDVPTYEENPIQKLKRVKKDSLRSLIGPQAFSQYYSFKIFGRFPCFTLPWILDGALDSLFLSNVPCAKKKFQYLNGPDMIEIAAWPPHLNDTGISIALVSYNGQLKVSGSADSNWLTREELENILELIPLEINNMGELCH